MELHYLSLLDVAEALRSREISPLELTRAMLSRIEALEPRLHAYALVTADRALAQAARAETEIGRGEHRGPLHGVPIAVKDIFNTAGVTTAAGMPLHDNHVPATDATVVRRLAEAGAVLLGKLQLTEGAFVTHHPSVIAPSNPWHADYYAGASSSGAGVATAAGLCFGALGSDTGGSIRFPSAANGLTGLKPTWGRVSRHGVFALAESLDHVGPMARSAADAGALLQAIAGLDPLDPTTLAAPVPDYLRGLDAGIDDLCVGIDVAYNETGSDDETIQTMRHARAVLESLGVSVKEVRLPDTSAVVAAWGDCCSVETAIAHEATWPSLAPRYGGLARLIESGHAVGGIQAMEAHHRRLSFSGALAALFAEVDLLLIPTQPRADFTIAQEAEEFSTPQGLFDFLRFAAPFDMSGSPTITLHGGFTARGMPRSFQLVGRHLGEATLIRAGHAYQRATEWHRAHPGV